MGGDYSNYWDNGGQQAESAPAPTVDAGAIVQQMYQEILGRAPDPGGYEAFVNAVNSGADLGALAASMANSQEAHNNAASGQGPSQQQAQSVVQNIASNPTEYVQQAVAQQTNQDYVKSLYTTLLGREPDAAGLQVNINAIASGQITPQQLAASIANSQEAKNRVANGQASQQQLSTIATSMGNSYGAPDVKLETDAAGYPSGWENVSPAELARLGITNPAILAAAAEGKLDNPTFGSLGLDARTVEQAINTNQPLPPSFQQAQARATIVGAPAGDPTGSSRDARGNTTVYYTNGGSVTYDLAGQAVSISPALSAYRQVPGSSFAVTDNPGFTMFNGKMVSVSNPQYNWSNGQVALNDGIPTRYVPPSSGGFFEKIGSDLATFDTSVRTAIPGGWGTIGMIALTVATYGATSELLAAQAASEAAFIAADAATLAANGANAAAIAQNLAISYGISAEAAAAIAASAATATTTATTAITATSVEAALAGGATPAQMISVGYSPASLLSAGIPASEVTAAIGSAGAGQLMTAPVVGNLLSAGASAANLLAAGTPLGPLLAGGASIASMVAEGVTAANLLTAGASAASLFAPGSPFATALSTLSGLSGLVTSGVSPTTLLNAGATVTNLTMAGTPLAQVLGAVANINNGYQSMNNVSQLLKAGATPNQVAAEAEKTGANKVASDLKYISDRGYSNTDIAIGLESGRDLSTMADYADSGIKGSDFKAMLASEYGIPDINAVDKFIAKGYSMAQIEAAVAANPNGGWGTALTMTPPVPPYIIASYGPTDLATGTIFTDSATGDQMVAVNGKNVLLSDYVKAIGSNQPISVDGQITAGTSIEITGSSKNLAPGTPSPYDDRFEVVEMPADRTWYDDMKGNSGYTGKTPDGRSAVFDYNIGQWVAPTQAAISSGVVPISPDASPSVTPPINAPGPTGTAGEPGTTGNPSYIPGVATPFLPIDMVPNAEPAGGGQPGGAGAGGGGAGQQGTPGQPGPVSPTAPSGGETSYSPTPVETATNSDGSSTTKYSDGSTVTRNSQGQVTNTTGPTSGNTSGTTTGTTTGPTIGPTTGTVTGPTSGTTSGPTTGPGTTSGTGTGTGTGSGTGAGTGTGTGGSGGTGGGGGGGGIVPVVPMPLVPITTTPSTTTTTTTYPIPKYTGKGLVNPGVNPGWIEPSNPYAAGNVGVNQYNYGKGQYIPTMDRLGEYNNPAPVSPYGHANPIGTVNGTGLLTPAQFGYDVSNIPLQNRYTGLNTLNTAPPAIPGRPGTFTAPTYGQMATGMGQGQQLGYSLGYLQTPQQLTPMTPEQLAAIQAAATTTP